MGICCVRMGLREVQFYTSNLKCPEKKVIRYILTPSGSYTSSLL